MACLSTETETVERPFGHDFENPRKACSSADSEDSTSNSDVISSSSSEGGDESDEGDVFLSISQVPYVSAIPQQCDFRK